MRVNYVPLSSFVRSSNFPGFEFLSRFSLAEALEVEFFFSFGEDDSVVSSVKFQISQSNKSHSRSEEMRDAKLFVM